MLQVVVDGLVVVLEQRVGVPQAVAGLRLHGSVFKLPSQQQRLSKEGINAYITITLFLAIIIINTFPPAFKVTVLELKILHFLQNSQTK